MLAANFSWLLHGVMPNDQILILTSSNMFSTAINIASWLKYYSGQSAVLIGECMWDSGKMLGEGGTASMPNSKIAFRYTITYHDWENGRCLSQIGTCFIPELFLRNRSGLLVA